MSFQPFHLQPLFETAVADGRPPTGGHSRGSSATSQPGSPHLGGLSAAALGEGRAASLSSSPPVSSSPGKRASRLLSEVAARTSFRRHSAAGSQDNQPNPPDRALPYRLTCAEWWQNNLFVGTDHGQVRHYYWLADVPLDTDEPAIPSSLSSPPPPPPKPATATPPSFIQTLAVGNGGRARIETVRVVAEFRTLIVFSEATLWFYSLPDLTPLAPPPFTPIRGVLSFAVNSAPRDESPANVVVPVVLYVSRRRTIQVIHLSRHGLQVVQEVPFPSGAVRLGAWNEQVCLADPHNYGLLNLRLPRPPVGLVPTNLTEQSGRTPHIVPIKPDEFFIVTASGVDGSALGMFVNTDGDAVRGTLSLDGYPLAVGYRYPYLLILGCPDLVTVYDITDQRPVQTLRFPTGSQVVELCPVSHMRLVPPHHLHAVSPEYRIPANFLPVGRQAVFSIALQPLPSQVNTLLDDFQHAGEAVGRAETAVRTHYRSPLRYAELALVQQRAGLLNFGAARFDDALSLFKRGCLPPALLVTLYPDHYRALGNYPYAPVPGLMTTLRQIGTIDRIIQAQVPTDTAEPEAARAGYQTAAEDTLIRYLQFAKESARNATAATSIAATTTPPAPRWDPLDQRVINTLLLRYYLEEGSDKIYNILRDGGVDCALDVAEPLLQRHHKRYALALLYRAHDRPAEALATYQTMVEGVDGGNDQLVEPRFGGVKEMFDYLVTLKRADLAWQFAPPILQRSEIMGAQLFIAVADTGPSDPDEVDRILAKLRTAGPSGAAIYLEHMVRHDPLLGATYHDQVIELLVEQIRARLTRDGQAPSASFGPLLHDYHQAWVRSGGLTFGEFLQTQAHAPLARIRSQLLDFLQWSDRYDLELALERLEQVGSSDTIDGPDSDDETDHGEAGSLDSEIAIVLGKRGDHDRALRTLVQRVQDYTAAELYCQAIADPDERAGYFLSLLRYYLELERRDEDTAALVVNNLITRYGASLDTLEVLTLLPPTWSVESLEPFLKSALQRLTHQRRNQQIVKGLVVSQNRTVGALDMPHVSFRSNIDMVDRW
ncbi:hypothetical protein IWQ60_002841 [Tieghemiomyces parasiticus]|uniref:CNH domain-containing protein n=1 Tax=Tieghemiomyces parasiticus TaxID=78921 RepID=A0A9W8AGP5_9FUNG|nr:hypothetical protein IWQ60_002841 [Tieghemiomyces parasiticus]